MTRVVLKLGGEILERPAEVDAIADDVRILVERGDPVILVHGGGPQTSALQERLGQKPNIVGGRRITDREALDAIEMVVGGKLNIELCARLTGRGAKPVGLTVAVRAVKRPPRVVSGCGDAPVDFGHVGDVVGVNHDLLRRLTDGGYVPVLASLGTDEAGGVYNINADIVATQVAATIGADRVVLVTGIGGVLRDVNDPASRIPRMSVAEAREAIASGAVKGGMIPKLEESFSVIAAGVAEVQIVGRMGPGELLRSIDSPGAVGTSIVR